MCLTRIFGKCESLHGCLTRVFGECESLPGCVLTRSDRDLLMEACVAFEYSALQSSWWYSWNLKSTLNI
jgi:hypothetical protein